MPKSLTRAEFEEQLQAKVEFLAESRVRRLMALELPDLELLPVDVLESADGTLALSAERLRAYVGVVAGEMLASFDEALLDVVYAEDA